MSEMERYESLWTDWITKTSSQLQFTHSLRVGEPPFDTWVGWYCSAPLRPQGWKLHLSPHAEIMGTVLETLVELSQRLSFDFKIIGQFKNFVRLNAGHLGETQVGKAITIYPKDDETALALYRELHALSQHFEGPQCPSDFYFDDRDRISFRWGQIGELETTYDSLGKPQHWLKTTAGHKIVDQREIPAKEIEGVPLLVFEGIELKPLSVRTPEVIEWDSENYRVKHNYGRLLKQVLLVENTNTHQLFILKRLWKGLGLTYRGRTYKDEAINEARINKHLLERNFHQAPRILCQRETGQFFETLMEDAGGESLEKLPLEVLKVQWNELLNKIQKLHGHGVVHRDLKRRNLVMSSKPHLGLQIIDFELAGYCGEKLPCASGTSSYKAPECEPGVSFSAAIDTYSLGSILFEATLGRDPSLYLVPEQERIELLRLNGFTRAAELVARCYETADRRIAIGDLQKTCQEAPPFEKQTPDYSPVSDDEVDSAIAETLQCLKPYEDWQTDGTLQWRNNHLLSTVKHRGLNIGSSGILLALLELLEHQGPNQPKLSSLIEATAEGLFKSEPYAVAHGLMTGNAGVSYALSKSSLVMNETRWLDRAIELWKLAAAHPQDSDFFSGAAGILFAGCHLVRHHQAHELTPICERLVQHLLDEVTDYEGLWAWPPSPTFGGNATLGASHGAAGIAMALSHWAHDQGDQSLMEFSTEVLQRIFDQGRTPQGHYLRYDVHPHSQPRASSDWCHGAGSFLWALLNSECSRETLKEPMDWAARLFSDSPSIGNPTYCHGLAGQLELSQMMGDFERSARLQRALLLQRRPFQGVKTWPSENPEQFTPDLWVGSLGPAVALRRAQQGLTTALLRP